MPLEVDDVLKQLQKLERARATVKAASISDVHKSMLQAQIDVKVKELERALDAAKPGK